MDRIQRAEAILAAAHARHPQDCLPGRANSPADRLGTLTLSHELIAQCDRAAKQEAALRELARLGPAPDGAAGVVGSTEDPGIAATPGSSGTTQRAKPRRVEARSA